MEFNLTTDLGKITPKAIVFNYADLKKELEKKIVDYKSLVVTENEIKSAKSDRAKLNKLKEALNNKKIEVKKQYLAPYEIFETQVKDLMSIIDEGVKNIDGQLKEFEQKELESKFQEMIDYYVDNYRDYTEILPLKKIAPEKWKNKTCKIADIKKQIDEKVSKFENDLRVIKAMRLDCEEQMLNAYIETLDISAALNEKPKYEKQQVLNKNKKEQPAKETVSSAQKEQPKEQETTKTIDVRFFDTTSEFRAAMKELTTKFNIRYGNVPKGE